MKEFAIKHPWLTVFFIVPAIAGVTIAGIKAIAGQPISGPVAGKAAKEEGKK